MTVSEAERQKLKAEFEAEQKERLRQRMSELGRKSTPRKRLASRKSLKKATAVRLAKRVKKSEPNTLPRKSKEMRIL